jgi:hypothetical protein
MPNYRNIVFSLLVTVILFILVSISATYNVTYDTLGKMFGVKEVDWKPQTGGPDFACIGFWVHTLVFALLMFVAILVNKKITHCF